MSGARRRLADVKVPGCFDISRPHFRSKARRTSAIKVLREDDDCKSGHATKYAAPCFGVEYEEAVRATKTSRLESVHFVCAESRVSVFSHGDDFVVLGTICPNTSV